LKPYYAYLTGFLLLVAFGLALGISLGYILEQIGFYGTLLYYQIAESLITLVLGYAAIKLLSKAIIAYGKPRPTVDEVPLSKVVGLFGYGVLALLILSIFEINITGLLVGAGFLSIVVGLASQATLGNLFAGISMMVAKPFIVGDRITFSTWQYGLVPPSYTHGSLLPGYSGVIKDIGLMYTKLVLDDGRVLLLPSGIMNQAAIINYSISDKVDVEFRVELPIKTDLSKFRKEVARSIAKDKMLKSSVKNALNINIMDISLSNYGINVHTEATIESETYVKKVLSEAVFSAVRSVNARK
jgi:small-conductance mechanosensitive channel